jgi:hypothetical protein
MYLLSASKYIFLKVKQSSEFQMSLRHKRNQQVLQRFKLRNLLSPAPFQNNYCKMLQLRGRKSALNCAQSLPSQQQGL